MSAVFPLSVKTLTTAFALALLSGCASDGPLKDLGEGAAELAGTLLSGSNGLASGSSSSTRSNQAAERPMVRTRKVSPGNPGDLYSGVIRTGSGSYAVMLTLLDGRFSHVTYPDLSCASNLKASRSYYGKGDSQTFKEHVYLDKHQQCSPSDQVALKAQRDGSYMIRTFSEGQVTGEGRLVAAVVPVPDALVGDWTAKIGGEYGGPSGRLQVHLSQDGESYTAFEDNYCSGRSRFAFQASGRMHLSGYQEATECDDGGFVDYEQINRDTLRRSSFDPSGRQTSDVQMRRVK